MNIDEFKEQVSSVISSEAISAEFYFLFDGNGGMSVKTVDIDDADNTELGKMFISSITEKILLNDDLSLILLSSADDRIDAVYKYDLEDVPIQLTQLKTIIENENLTSFDKANDDLSNLEGILILLGNDQKQLAIYKHQYPITLIKRGSGYNLMKPKSGNRFKKLDTDILKINAKFEFLKINGQYYILDIKTLEKFFGFHDAVKKVAAKGIENIEETNIVMDCMVFKERLEDIAFSRKLVKSASKSPVLGVIPNSQIISFTNTHPALKGSFKYSKDGSQLNLKTKKSQNLFLKLLNDDFLQSELTKRFYDSIAKDSVEKATNEESDKVEEV